MQQRRGTATQWTDADPILASGEIGFETDTNQFKIGDGVNHWSDLSYFKNLEDLGGSLDDYILLTQKGSANGVATLDNTGKIPSSQIPDLVGLDSEIASSVADAVDNLVNGAPAALDTLNEIATVIGDSDNIVGSLITNIGGLNTSVANHSNATQNVHGITNTAELATHTYVTAELNDATTTLNATINNNYSALQGEIVQAVSDHADLTAGVHGITNFGDLATKSYADTAVSTHANDTTNVHGIADFADLASQSYAADQAEAARTAAEAAAGLALSAHESDTTSIHGISDTANLVYTSDSRLSDERTPSAGSVTAAKIAVDAVETAKIADNAVTNAKLADNAVDTAEIKDGAVTNDKLAGSIAQSKVTGLESALSDKLDSATAASTYAPIASPTFTGTVSGVTQAMVGLGNVDNTSDANKPVSTATQTALDEKANLSGATFTGAISGTSLTLSGNLTVNGTTTTVNTTNFTTSDPVIYLGEGNNANSVDLGFVASYNDGTYAHQGLVKDTSDGKWKLFKGVTDEPTTTVNFAQGSMDDLKVGALEATTVTPSSGVVFSDGTQTKVGVPSLTTIQQKTASYTLGALTDRDNLIEVSSTSSTTVTIPADSTLNFPVGTSLDILQTNTGQVTIAGAGGVTVNATPGLKLRTQWSSATITKRAANTWVVTGDLSA